jgi:hypothetical protein
MALLIMFLAFESRRSYPDALWEFWAALAAVTTTALVILVYAFWRYHMRDDFLKKK